MKCGILYYYLLVGFSLLSSKSNDVAALTGGGVWEGRLEEKVTELGAALHEDIAGSEEAWTLVPRGEQLCSSWGLERMICAGFCFSPSTEAATSNCSALCGWHGS